MTENLSFDYHRQDTDNFCGPACAQMVINQIGGGILPQALLFDEIVTNSVLSSVELNDWDSPPDGLRTTLNRNRPEAFYPNFFILYAEDTEENISRKIIWTIHRYQIAPVALVTDAAHWIVVTGYEATAAPADVADVSYGIVGFWVNDPYPVGTSPIAIPPPPHFSGDRCGFGRGYGAANSNIDYATWQGDYMTFVPDGSTWPGKFLAICDPEPAPNKPGMNIKKNFPADGEKIIAKSEAANQTILAIKNRKFEEVKFLNNILHHTKPGEPILVQRLDKPNTYYYIVPMEGSNGQTNALFSIDARYGSYKQACFAQGNDNPIAFKPISREEILEILEIKLELKKRKRKILIFPETIFVHPMMFWRPCSESLSPFMPFYLIFIGKTRVFIRMDGKLFHRLTKTIHGV